LAELSEGPRPLQIASMKNRVTKWTILLVVVALCGQCKDKYLSPYKSPNVGYLVVEGFHTAEGEDYLSDFVPYRVSPLIDSINWVNGPTGLTIDANTHDPANATRYYEWNFVGCIDCRAQGGTTARPPYWPPNY
jgi:hypothetical protein